MTTISENIPDIIKEEEGETINNIEEFVKKEEKDKEISQYLRDNICWQSFINTVASIGPQFNDAQWRFLKACIFETSIDVFSKGKIKYVALQGCDFIIPELNNIRIEMKYTEDALYTDKGKTPRNECKSLTLLNSNGSNTHIALPDSYADYLLIVGRKGAAVIDKPTLQKYIEIRGDSILAKNIPINKMHFIFTPETVSIPTVYECNLRDKIVKLIYEELKQFEHKV